MGALANPVGGIIPPDHPLPHFIQTQPTAVALCDKIYTRYFIFQIKAPRGHNTTFIISTYTINKVKYNNYFITINHVCHRLKQREVIQARLSIII
jgi:hypothetical protein